MRIAREDAEPPRSQQGRGMRMIGGQITEGGRAFRQGIDRDFKGFEDELHGFAARNGLVRVEALRDECESALAREREEGLRPVALPARIEAGDRG